jgi:hypothetical protein
MLGNVSLSPASFRIGVYFVSRKNSDFFENFFCEVCVNRQNNETGDLEWSPVSVSFRLVFIL